MRKCDRTIFRKEQIITVWANMANMPIGNHKKPVWKGCVCCNSISMTFWKSKTLVVGGNQWLWRLSWKRVFLWQWTILCDFIVVVGMFALEDRVRAYFSQHLTQSNLKGGFILPQGWRDACVGKGRGVGRRPHISGIGYIHPPSIHCRGTGSRDRQKGPEAGSVSHASLHITSFS